MDYITGACNWDQEPSETNLSLMPMTKTTGPKGPILLRENVNAEEANYLIAQCCNPIPGDDVMAIKDEMDQLIDS